MVLTAHYQTCRALAPQDVYKLLYQHVFGPEHSVENLATARERLYLEILQLPQAPSAVPLSEPLSSRLCRVNLQSFMQSGSSVEQLWQALCHTVQEFQPGTLDDLQRAWSVFLATPWAQRYAPEGLVQFWQSMATAGFPPVHHSRAYAEANAPHYRVILRTLLAEHLGGR